MKYNIVFLFVKGLKFYKYRLKTDRSIFLALNHQITEFLYIILDRRVTAIKKEFTFKQLIFFCNELLLLVLI